MKKERERIKALEALGEKSYNITYDSKKVTEEELEAFHRLKTRADDPMLNLMGK